MREATWWDVLVFLLKLFLASIPIGWGAHAVFQLIGTVLR